MQTVHVRLPAQPTNYDIKIGSGLIAQAGEKLRATVKTSAQRAAVISNKKVFALFGDALVRALRSSEFEVTVWLMKDDEQHKSLRSLEQALNFFSESGIERNDIVVALGGGV